MSPGQVSISGSDVGPNFKYWWVPRIRFKQKEGRRILGRLLGGGMLARCRCLSAALHPETGLVPWFLNTGQAHGGLSCGRAERRGAEGAHHRPGEGGGLRNPDGQGAVLRAGAGGAGAHPEGVLSLFCVCVYIGQMGPVLRKVGTDIFRWIPPFPAAA